MQHAAGLAQPCPALPSLAQPCPALPSLAQPCPALPSPGAPTMPRPVKTTWTCWPSTRKHRKATRPSGKERRDHPGSQGDGDTGQRQRQRGAAPGSSRQQQAAAARSFDYWLHLHRSTLERGQPLRVPVQWAAYHRAALAGKLRNTSTTLTRQYTGWWRTRCYDEQVQVETPKHAPVMGIDVGSATFITTATGQQYGTLHGKLAARHKRDREQRRRKAKLRACLKKKGVKPLPAFARSPQQEAGAYRAPGAQPRRQRAVGRPS